MHTLLQYGRPSVGAESRSEVWIQNSLSWYLEDATKTSNVDPITTFRMDSYGNGTCGWQGPTS